MDSTTTPDESTPDEATVDEEIAEAESAHVADRPPTAEEIAAADRYEAEHTDEDEKADVARHYKEMTEIGSEVDGEGKIE